jgi:hypothetical protein
MTYGIKVQPYNDPYIKIAEEAIESISELLIPGAFLVDRAVHGPAWPGSPGFGLA